MWIVSHDRLFAAALQTTLFQAGLPRPKLTTSLPETENAPLIVDLDDFEVPSNRRTVTFSSSPDRNADLTRPFLMRTFVSLCKSRFALDLPTLSPDADAALLLMTDEGVLLGGKPVALSPGERAVLRLLLNHVGECVPKDELDRLWKGSGNMTEVYIRYLRKKLDEPSGLRLIRTVRGKGYILCLPNTAL